MKSKLKTLIFPFFVVCMFVSLSLCISESPEEKSEELDLMLEPFEGNITFTINERYSGWIDIGEPRITLTMETEKRYPDCNYEIINSVTIKDDLISFVIRGIYIPTIVLPEDGPATNKTFLNISEGQYMLYITYKNDTDRYILYINSSSIYIDEWVSTFTAPSFTLWWRYPPDSFYCECGTPKENEWIAQDFFNNLTNEIDLTEFQLPDEGEIPYPRSRFYQNYTVQVKYFYFENEDDFDRAGQLLESYVENVLPQYSNVSITLRNWKNKYYHGHVD